MKIERQCASIDSKYRLDIILFLKTDPIPTDKDRVPYFKIRQSYNLMCKVQPFS